MQNNQIKKWGLIILIWLPIIPIALVVYYLNQYAGINLTLRLCVSLILISSYLAILFLGCYFIKKQNYKKASLISIISIAVIIGSGYFAYINFRVYHTLNQMIRTQSEISHSLVTLTQSEIQTRYDLENRTLAMLNITDERIAQGVEQFLEEAGLKESNEIIFYDSPVMMVHALYNGDLDAIIIDSNFGSVFSESRGFENIERETQVIETFTMTTEITLTNNIAIAEEPFSILLLGTNSMVEGNIHLGQVNTLMLATVNLQNLSVTLTSIPRDSYVSVPCFQYTRDKLSHTNAGGTSCIIQTVEHMFEMEIPYYIKLNFRGMIELVDAIGGIEVDVPFTFTEQNSRRQFGEHMITVYEGLQRLNGEEALALSRHRNSLPMQDLDRVENQQLVLESILNEMLTGGMTINDILSVLNVLGENVDTNLSINEMTAIAQFMISLAPAFLHQNPLEKIHINNMVLTGEIGRAHALSVIFPSELLIENYREIMMINLGKIDPIFKFDFTFNGFN